MYKFGVGDCVQFNEKHKWVGSLGFIRRIKQCGDDVRYMVGVPIPGKGVAYIFTMESANEIEFVGQCILIPFDDDEK